MSSADDIDVQAHRGRTAQGWPTSNGATGVTPGQKRLAIQDLSSADAQPMLAGCGGYALNHLRFPGTDLETDGLTNAATDSRSEALHFASRNALI